MATKITKRAIQPPAGDRLKPTVEGLFVAVNELSGTVGDPLQRAVRLCELVDAGIVAFDLEGRIVKPT